MTDNPLPTTLNKGKGSRGHLTAVASASTHPPTQSAARVIPHVFKIFSPRQKPTIWTKALRQFHGQARRVSIALASRRHQPTRCPSIGVPMLSCMVRASKSWITVDEVSVVSFFISCFAGMRFVDVGFEDGFLVRFVG